MADPVRIGVIGCGNVMPAYMVLAEQLRGQGLVELVYACDAREERKSLVLDRYRIPNFTTKYQELLESEMVDLALVLTSMGEHGPIAAAALEAGKHVLVEKPMAVTLEEAARLLELSRKSRGYLLCAPHVILSPTYQIIWNRVQRGDIGKVLTARGRYGHAGPTWGSWYYQRGGGALFDLAPYNLTSLTGILGPVRRVFAMFGTAIPERLVSAEQVKVDIEDNAHVLLDFGGNVFAAVTTGFTIQQYRNPAIELYGTEGTIQLMGDDWDPEGYELWLNAVGAWQIYKETDPNWLWTDGLRHLVDCIQKNTPPQITPEHAFHVLEVMIRAKESGQSGRAIEVGSKFPALKLDVALEPAQAHLVHDRTHRRD